MLLLSHLVDHPRFKDQVQQLQLLLPNLEESDSIVFIEDALRFLRRGRASIDCADIDGVLISLMEVSRTMPIDVEAPRFIAPEKYDVLLNDIHDSDLEQGVVVV